MVTASPMPACEHHAVAQQSGIRVMRVSVAWLGLAQVRQAWMWLEWRSYLTSSSNVMMKSKLATRFSLP